MKSFFHHCLILVESVLVTIFLVIIGFIPYVFFGYMGWLESESLDYLARIIGFFLVLAIIMWYCKWDAERG